ncbi:hypothetical protein [Roseateles sp.]|uniref:hypothetical protein n=1 Tax=Roseateles sp. TaxID=1971397 RepID=UPI0025F4DFF9|nr:hypothetical protein [Roseateles sp.]MBV8036545.1 hypothetical protein [Roseateles sp.]
MPARKLTALACAAIAALALSACGGGSAQATIGGTVSGLATGSNLTLTEGPTTTTLMVGSNGAFDMPGTVSADSTYAVTVQTQPPGQTCSVSNGSGTTDDEGDSIDNVMVSCVNNISVGGTVSGLSVASSVTLSDGISSLTVAGPGSFSFPDSFSAGQAYMVSVTAQPAGQTCGATINGAGTIDAAGDSVSNVIVSCVAMGTVNGTVSGLVTGGSLTVSDGQSNLVLSQNGLFGFVDMFAPGAAYGVSVTQAPAGQSCAVSAGQGNLDSAGDAVLGVQVACYGLGTLNGTVTGLAAGATVTLSDGVSSLSLGSNGGFAFMDSFPASAAYGVSVTTQPTGQTCTVTGGSGSIDSNDSAVTGIAVTCV